MNIILNSILLYHCIVKKQCFFCCLWNSESWLDWLFRIEVC